MTDIIYPVPHHYKAIETKAKGQKPTPRQEACLTAVKKAGGAAFWCDSFEGFLIALAAYGLTPMPSK